MPGLGPYATPGPQAATTGADYQILWMGLNGEQNAAVLGGTIASTIVDAGNTPTTVLRGGLLMSSTSAGVLTVYDPDALTTAQGNRVPCGFLTDSIKMTDALGTAYARQGNYFKTGLVRRDNVVGLDAQAEAVLVRTGVVFDDNEPSGAAFLPCAKLYKTVTADTTVTAADNGTCFVSTMTGDIEFTLPAIATSNGLSFEFLQTIDDEMLITSAEGNNIILKNNLSADGISFTTDGSQIGAHCRVKCIFVDDAPKWIFENLYHDCTVTVISA